MSLKDRLYADFKDAMKAHDKVRKEMISMVRAVLINHGIAGHAELDDEGIIGILTEMVGKCKMPSLILKRPEVLPE